MVRAIFSFERLPSDLPRGKAFIGSPERAISFLAGGVSPRKRDSKKQISPEGAAVQPAFLQNVSDARIPLLRRHEDLHRLWKHLDIVFRRVEHLPVILDHRRRLDPQANPLPPPVQQRLPPFILHHVRDQGGKRLEPQILDQIQLPNQEGNPERILIKREMQWCVAHVLQYHLRRHHREVLVLRDLQGFSYAEISEILGISLSSVKTRLHRARMAFRDHFIRYGCKAMVEEYICFCDEVEAI